MPVVHNYLKARFADAVAAAEVVPQIAALMHQGQQARAFWQARRRMEQQGRRAEFWMHFRASYPDIFCCLGHLAGGDCDEALIGFLEFGRPDAIELFADGPFVCLKAADLWCGADWDLLAAFLKSRFGAEGASWISDDPGIDFFDLLEP